MQNFYLNNSKLGQEIVDSILQEPEVRNELFQYNVFLECKKQIFPALYLFNKFLAEHPLLSPINPNADCCNFKYKISNDPKDKNAVDAFQRQLIDIYWEEETYLIKKRVGYVSLADMIVTNDTSSNQIFTDNVKWQSMRTTFDMNKTLIDNSKHYSQPKIFVDKYKRSSEVKEFVYKGSLPIDLKIIRQMRWNLEKYIYYETLNALRNSPVFYFGQDGTITEPAKLIIKPGDSHVLKANILLSLTWTLKSNHIPINQDNKMNEVYYLDANYKLVRKEQELYTLYVETLTLVMLMKEQGYKRIYQVCNRNFSNSLESWQKNIISTCHFLGPIRLQEIPSLPLYNVGERIPGFSTPINSGRVAESFLKIDIPIKVDSCNSKPYGSHSMNEGWYGDVQHTLWSYFNIVVDHPLAVIRCFHQLTLNTNTSSVILSSSPYSLKFTVTNPIGSLANGGIVFTGTLRATSLWPQNALGVKAPNIGQGIMELPYNQGLSTNVIVVRFDSGTHTPIDTTPAAWVTIITSSTPDLTMPIATILDSMPAIKDILTKWNVLGATPKVNIINAASSSLTNWSPIGFIVTANSNYVYEYTLYRSDNPQELVKKADLYKTPAK